MMSPTWILDVFAALMLVIATVSGTRLAAARLPAGWQLAGWRSEVVQAGPRSRPRASAGADHDVTHLLMGVTMAGMLAPSLATLAPGGWEAIFGALTGWFAWRSARDVRATGIRSLVGGHGAVHLLQCAAMVYLFAAVTTSGSMAMTGAGAAPQSLESPALALAFASVLAAYTRLGHRPAVGATRSPGGSAASRRRGRRPHRDGRDDGVHAVLIMV